MEHDDRNDGGMRPRLGQSSLVLPVTFDYSGGRRESKRSRITWSIILMILALIVGLGVLFSSEGTFISNVLICAVVLGIATSFIRIKLLREPKIRREYIQLRDTDYEREYREFWGIYNISDTYPYYCRFRNGKSGLFIRLNKDVILGKYSESEFEHYEAIGDAYNLAGEGRVQICHLDYMDNVGTDERLEESFVSLSDVTNGDLKDLLTDIFTYQQEQMMARVTTFDAYLFLWNGSDINAWSTIQRILSCFLEANYRSYHILNSEDLRELAKVMFNLHDFSAIESMSSAFTTNSNAGIIPISVEYSDGSVDVLNKTIQERKEEQELQRKERELKKQELKRRKSGKKKVVEEEEIDLFDE